MIPAASKDNIIKCANRFWKKGGNNARTLEEKLLFLAGTRKRHLVGRYLQNENIKHWDKLEEIFKNRTKCERKHSQLKSLLKFDVIGYRRDTRCIYAVLHFIAFQVMTLAHLQNGFQNPTSLAQYY